jgi:hypothetical protein
MMVSTQPVTTAGNKALGVTWIFVLQTQFEMTHDVMRIAVGYLAGELMHRPFPFEELPLVAATCFE